MKIFIKLLLLCSSIVFGINEMTAQETTTVSAKIECDGFKNDNYEKLVTSATISPNDRNESADVRAAIIFFRKMIVGKNYLFTLTIKDGYELKEVRYQNQVFTTLSFESSVVKVNWSNPSTKMVIVVKKKSSDEPVKEKVQLNWEYQAKGFTLEDGKTYANIDIAPLPEGAKIFNNTFNGYAQNLIIGENYRFTFTPIDGYIIRKISYDNNTIENNQINIIAKKTIETDPSSKIIVEIEASPKEAEKTTLNWLYFYDGFSPSWEKTCADISINPMPAGEVIKQEGRKGSLHNIEIGQTYTITVTPIIKGIFVNSLSYGGKTVKGNTITIEAIKDDFEKDETRLRIDLKKDPNFVEIETTNVEADYVFKFKNDDFKKIVTSVSLSPNNEGEEFINKSALCLFSNLIIGKEYSFSFETEKGYVIKEIHYNNKIFKSNSITSKIVRFNNLDRSTRMKIFIGKEVILKIPKTDNGSITFDGYNNGDKAITGDTVKIIVTPDKGYELKTLSIRGLDIKKSKEFIVDEDNTIEVEFQKIASSEYIMEESGSIYHNPHSDVINLSNFTPNENIALFNLNGELILLKKISNMGSSSFNVSSLPRGIYILKISNKIKKIVLK